MNSRGSDHGGSARGSGGSHRFVVGLIVCGLTVPSLVGCATTPPNEFVNIAYTPSVDVTGYERWTFDLTRCVDPGAAGNRAELLGDRVRTAVRTELEERGFPAVAEGEEPDFLVWTELRVVALDAGADSDGGEGAGVRGKLFVGDVSTGRTVWRGERRVVSVRTDRDEAEVFTSIDAAVADLIGHLEVLGAPFDAFADGWDDPPAGGSDAP